MNRYEVVAGFIDRAVEDQNWYRRNANWINGTLAAVAGVLVYLLAYIQTSGNSPQLEQLLVAVVPFLTAISLRLTKNGIGSVQAAELKQKVAKEDAHVEQIAAQPQPHYSDKVEDVLDSVSNEGASHPTLDQLRDIIEENRK